MTKQIKTCFARIESKAGFKEAKKFLDLLEQATDMAGEAADLRRKAWALYRKHTAEEARCDNCRHFRAGEGVLGVCTLMPPTIHSQLVAMNRDDGHSGSDAVKLSTDFPVMHGECCCGQHDPA